MARTVIRIEEDILDHPVEQVWSLVSSFGAIQAWMRSIKWCTISGQGVGTVRTVMSMAGVQEEILEVLDNDAHCISYRIKDNPFLPMKGGFGNWKLESIGGGKTKVTWIADAEEINTDGVAAIAPIYEGFMKESIAGLKKALS
ncbi:uncharacterized protein A1O5_11625 [Cladophialophora psammophila CBS 110553]|uniref:SRPBCC family protein n=1 Tax=Cladophialophora psammophila CBS 110553 TaxID=1182543 RepID=W9WYI0_9EURO|nr:uncharacterized protein A1O5_11625 [Cladophialophora psammophila CBS 110553]EXJ63304.1 hypothetical protein A1O5_11625 [Cladophialophora psammophila CBS 110553]